MAYNQPQELIFLKTQTASNSASISFTSFITSQYPTYFLKVRGLVPVTTATSLLLTYSTDNGATYLATNYKWAVSFGSSTGVAGVDASASDSSIRLPNNVSSTASLAMDLDISLFGFGAAKIAMVMGDFTTYGTTAHSGVSQFGGMNTDTTGINAIKFAMSSGNISAGTFTLYASTI